MGARFITLDLWSACTFSAASAETEFPVTALNDWDRTDRTRSTGLSGQYWRWDFGESQEWNCLAIIDYNAGNDAVFTVNAGSTAGGSDLKSDEYDAWEQLYGADDIGADMIGADGYLFSADVPVYFPAGNMRLIYFDQISSRYGSLAISDPANPDGYLQLGLIVPGQYLETARNVRSPLEPDVVSTSLFRHNDKNQPRTNVRESYRTLSFEFRSRETSEIYGVWEYLKLKVVDGTPFIADLFPNASDHMVRLRNQLYCQIPQGGSQKTSISGPAFMSDWGATIRELS